MTRVMAKMWYILSCLLRWSASAERNHNAGSNTAQSVRITKHKPPSLEAVHTPNEPILLNISWHMHTRNNSLMNDIVKLEGELVTMAAAEQDLVLQLESLRSSMQKLRFRVNHLRNHCTLIGSLPNELLGLIFESGPSAIDDGGEFAMSISQVSQRWRNIAIGTHSLWASIRIDYWCIGEGQFEILDMFIARSLDHPLDITIKLRRDDDDDDYWKDFLEQTSKIFPHVSRWRSFCISGNIREDIFDVLEPLESVEAPMLEAFEVKIKVSPPEWEADDFDEPLHLFQGGAPRLIQIAIYEISIFSCQPPISSVVSLRLHHPPNFYDIEQYRSLLNGSSNLTDLELVGKIVDTDQLYMVALSETSKIEIPSLRSLTISPSWSAASFTLYSLLASLDTPTLESLTLHCCPWKSDVSEFQEVFRNYGPPRYPHLRSLTLLFADFSQPVALWFTSVLPSITRIALIECKSPDTLLELLLPSDNCVIEHTASFGAIQDQSSTVNLPLLRDVCLSSVDLAELDVLCDMISDRASRSTSIASVQIPSKNFSSIPEERRKWLQDRVHIKDFKFD